MNPFQILDKMKEFENDSFKNERICKEFIQFSCTQTQTQILLGVNVWPKLVLVHTFIEKKLEKSKDIEQKQVSRLQISLNIKLTTKRLNH